MKPEAIAAAAGTRFRQADLGTDPKNLHFRQSPIFLANFPVTFPSQKVPATTQQILPKFGYAGHRSTTGSALSMPHRMTSQRPIRAVIDAKTAQTLGEGVYRDPEISWDATRIVFCNKQKADGVTSIYEIGIEGVHALDRDRHPDYDPPT